MRGEDEKKEDEDEKNEIVNVMCILRRCHHHRSCSSAQLSFATFVGLDLFQRYG